MSGTDRTTGVYERAPVLVPFSAITDTHRPLVGSKAYHLGKLTRAGFPVPEGFCLTIAAMRSFIRHGALKERLERIVARLEGGGLDTKESWAFLGETRRLMVKTPLPEPLEQALRTAYEEQLGGATVAVRSSGTREDLEDASFAGQYESFLNVRGFSFLLDAVRRCWASIWRNRVLLYVGRQSFEPEDLALGVIVQRLVKARCSGVLFTVDPLSGRDDRMLVEATIGLGETLVSGKVNPDRFVIAARSGEVIEQQIAEKRRRLRALQSVDAEGHEVFSGGLDEEEVDDEQAASQASLGVGALRRLARLGADVQVHCGRPMDIEWAQDAQGRLLLVQARPITRIGFEPGIGEWTDANFKDGGVASDVCVPLMASLYERIFSSTMDAWWVELGVLPEPGRVQWLRVMFARPYWNVGEVKRALLTLPGFVERDFDEDLGIETPYEGLGRTSRTTLKGLVRGIGILWRQRRMLAERLERAKAFVEPFLREYEELDAVDLDALSDRELIERHLRLMNETYVRTESTYFLTAYAVSIIKLEFKAVYDKVARLCGQSMPSYLDLVSGLENVAHLRPYVDLYRLIERHRRAGGRGLPELHDFVWRYRHHSVRELDITVARWGEDPSFVEQTAKQYLEAGLDDDPREIERRQVERFEQARRALERAFERWPLRFRPWLRRRFWRGLNMIRTIAWWREEVRDCSIRCYWLVRRSTLAVGRRLCKQGVLERPDDLFYLRWPQIEALLTGKLAAGEARKEIEWQRRYVEGFRRFDPPHEIGSRFEHDSTKRASVGGKRLRGVAGSPGTARGRVRVVRRLEEAGKLEKGDILVTVFTDPGWTPLMSLAGALVTETGGLLSHAAVISREYGIPAVLACANATASLRDGDEVVVDGAAGLVERVRASLD